ncbi:hypothetical protein NPIL_585731, partial [Nephila pilipes]
RLDSLYLDLFVFSIEHNHRHDVFDEKSKDRPTVSGIRVRRGYDPRSQDNRFVQLNTE